MPPGTRYQDDDEDEELFEEIEPPRLESGFSKAIIVDNIPIVPGEKFPKLLSVLKKIYESIGPVQNFHVPQDDKKNTLGYCFVEFEDAATAELALEKTNGYKLDKSHNFKVSPYNDLARYSKISDTYQPGPLKPYQPTENLRSWLLDERGCDQFVTKAGEVVEIFWNDKPTEQNVESVLKRDKFTETYVQWSPRGTYIVTMHARGVQLWAGSKWERVARLAQLKPVLVDFSPCENYIVTASSHYKDNDTPNDPQCIIVWDIRTQRKLRGFLSSGSSEWPIFKWSHDDKYLARLVDSTIFVYQAPSMELLGGKPLEMSQVDAFAWSPSDNTISYFVAETDDKPASVVLLDVPSRKERRKQNLFSVKDCRMHWHPSGDFLCVKVDRWTKNKKSTYTNFEVFRMRVKDIPIEQLELKVAIHAFAWEPKGIRFAVIHGEQGRVDVSFYTMDKQLRLLKTLDKKAANTLFWSPQGQHIVLAGLGQSGQGQLEFYDVNALETMGSDEHYTSTGLEWDPTGRYVTSTVSFWKHQVETGYKLYSFQGRLLKSVLKDKFFAFSWRPRPPSLLSDERIKHIQKNIKQLAQDYKKHDLDKRKTDYELKRTLRLNLRNQFVELLQRKQQQYDQQAAQRQALLADDDQDDEQQQEEEQFDFRETYVEELIDQQEINID